MVELLLPAGNMDCLRAAVNNGADAVYLGLNNFNARRKASNFDEKNIFSVVDYCHKRDVKVYITLNTLVKNSELDEYFRLVNLVYVSKADAVIIQDPCFIPFIKKNFPKLRIHLSTQASNFNTSIPDVDRIVLERHISLDDIKNISKTIEIEVFVHGALCFSCSGQCLFSSMVGGRSGNRGVCAQPCRQKYNNKYVLSTKDLCLIDKIPTLTKAGVKSLKVEGRMRSALYVATVARIYRKAIDTGKFTESDINELKLVFNREFTEGLAFEDNIVDNRKPMNRGLFIGVLENNKLKLRHPLKLGDGIGIWVENKVRGFSVNQILLNKKKVKSAKPEDIVDLDFKALNGTPVYKTSSVDSKLFLGDKLKNIKPKFVKSKIRFSFSSKPNNNSFRIFVKCYSKEEALASDKAGADIIYYPALRKDCFKVKQKLKNAKFFMSTPRIVNDEQAKEVIEKINKVRPDGVLVGNRAFLNLNYKMHLDYSLNVLNDVDLKCYNALPIISPELSLHELRNIKNKNFIVMVHGDVILMSSRQKLKCPELVDEDNRHFRVRVNGNITEILNCSKLGLFNLSKDLLNAGIKYFYIDLEKDSGKFTSIYKRILSGSKFDDKKIRKGHTTGHFGRGVI